MTGARVTGFVPPVYPFDKLTSFAGAAAKLPGGAVDLSVGTPCDPPAAAVVEALGASGTERGYPTSIGSVELREAASAWMERRLGVTVDPATEMAACIGTKELVAGVPQWLHLRSPERDTVLCPSLAYPTYEMGAILAGLRPIAVPARPDGTLDLESVVEEDAGRALCLWVNSPGNPGGQLEDLHRCASWGRARAVPVFSDECYIEFTWAGPGRTILQSGMDGVVAVHSLSKRSNLAGVRSGIFAGDPDLVSYLAAVRRHAGFMVPGPVQHASAVAFGDDAHVEAQRERYLERMEYLAGALSAAGIPAALPGGSFYLWVRAGERSAAADEVSAAFRLTGWLAEHAGVVVSPGDTYGPSGTEHVRLALVQPMDRLALVAERLARAPAPPGFG